MKYSAADLRHKIIIQKRGEDATDENGNPVESWLPITEKPIWAAKRGLTGRTFYAAAQVNAEDNILFAVRCNAVTKTITANMRIVEGPVTTDGVTTYAHTYTITAPPVDVADAHQWIEIHAKEVT